MTINFTGWSSWAASQLNRWLAAAAILCALDPPGSAAAGPEWQSADIGNPTTSGTLTVTGNVTRVTAAGEDIGRARDQFFFAHRFQTGDFDVTVRVAALENVDVWTKSGLMARDTLDGASRFAAVLTTPTLSGSYFGQRSTDGGNATAVGSFPSNLPESWLRLARSGDTFSGFASIDGQRWHPLGSATVGMPSTLWLGLAVASHRTNQVATAEFADFRQTGTVDPSLPVLPREAIGPTSRRTGLVISEIMYDSRAADAQDDFEFVELFNANPFYEDVSGYKLSRAVDFTFPPGTVIQGGGFLLVGKNPSGLRQAYGITNAFGPYAGTLPASGTLRLRNKAGAVLLEIPYSNRAPWPVAADGSGHSLVLARPSHGEADPRAWSHSYLKGGSPGRVDTMPSGPLEQVVINEFLANGSDASPDYIELFNRGPGAVDISGCSLSDTAETARFRIRPGTLLPAHGFAVFTQNQLGFGLGADGEGIYLGTPDGQRILDSIRFDAQAPGVPSGRFPDGVDDFYSLARETRGGANSEPLKADIIFNELMYHPLSENANDEFVELFNRTTTARDLSRWKLSGGIEFEFPAGTRIDGGGYLVIARNAARLLTSYTNLNAANTGGDFRGRLSGGGERIVLLRPEPSFNAGAATASPVYVIEDEVSYGTGGSWGHWADGGGSSLERVDPESSGRRGSDWADSDESGKSDWATIELTGTLRDGSGSPDSLQVLMLGAGECLLDNVEVLSERAATNLVANGTFDAGMNQWSALGDHVRSTAEARGGAEDSGCLHIRATNQGEPLANHLRTGIRQASLLVSGQQATLRARARWLCGIPELVLRIKGNHLEAFKRLPVPLNLGTPGARNSSTRPEAGPAIFEVSHWPVLPATAEPVVVTARVEDRHGLASVQLNYRLDPSTNYLAVEMLDNGTEGDALANDGVFSATIPAPGTPVLAAFYVDAICAGSPGAEARFPTDAPKREALVRFGEVIPASGFGTYRLWFTAATLQAWRSRPVLSNDELDATFVYGNQRVVYNIGIRYSGSPWHQGGYDSPVGRPCTYSFSTPGDQRVLGTTSFNKLHALGNTPGDDSSLQREQVAYWMVRQLGLPWNYQRYVQVYVNGQRRGQLMEDTQVPGGDSLRENFPDDSEGNLYKLNGWYEPESPGGASFHLAAWCALNKIGGEPKQEGRYRWNWAARAVGGSANDYDSVFALIDAANPRDGEPFEDVLTGIADIPQWLRTFAIEHAVGNWDSFGNRNAQNMYAYKPVNGRWQLIIWDYNIVLGNSGSDGPSGDDLFQTNFGDQGMRRIYGSSAFVRTYLRNLQEIAAGPLLNTHVDPVIDARYAAFQASGINASAPGSIKSWISSRRRYISNYLTNFQTEFTLSAPAGTHVTTNQNWISLSGTAPIGVASIRVNNTAYPVTWTDLLQWSVTVPLTSATISLLVEGCDSGDQPLPGARASVQVTTTASFEPPRMVINEIMHHAAIPGAEYIEIVNASPTAACDLSGYRLSGVDFEFPTGLVVLPGQYVVVAADRSAFVRAHGTSVAPIGEFANPLDPAAQTLRLTKRGVATPLDVVVDEVSYASTPPWPAEANHPGVSLQLIDPAEDNRQPGNWMSLSPDAVANPQWKFVSVTGTAGSSSRLLLYHSPFQPERDPFDIEGRWDGTIGFPGQSPFEMTALFSRGATGSWSGQFSGGGSTAPLVVRVTASTNVQFSFPPEYGPVSWRGRLSPDGTTLSGTFSQTAQGQSISAPFSLRRYQDPDVALGGEVHIDDVSLVAGSTPTVGANLIRNGDFESPLAEVWQISSNHAASSLSTELRHSGNASLYLKASRGGADLDTAIWQETGPLVAGQTYTLSYWYLPSTNANELTLRTADHALVSNHSIRPGTTASPGTKNTIDNSLPPLPALVLTEIQAQNTSGIQDRLGHREPWVEILNRGAAPVSLEGLFLSDSVTQPDGWAFPDDAVIQPGQYLIVWLDAAANESSPGEWHANFRPRTGEGVVVLAAQVSGQMRLVDVLQYVGLGVDQSYGLALDETGSGQGFHIGQPTPGQPNRPLDQPLAPVVINEWMASNTRSIVNPASGRFDDWFELFNPNDQPVDLSGYFLTDDGAFPRQWQIPASTVIEPNGFLLIWADERTELNGGTTGLHTNFKLGQDGEFIGLFAPDGSVFDTIEFEAQVSDVSEGRWPQATLEQVRAFTRPTPGSPNIEETAASFRIAFMTWSKAGFTINWASEPGGQYQLQFQDALGSTTWSNLGGLVTASAPATAATDSAPPVLGQRFYRVLRKN